MSFVPSRRRDFVDLVVGHAGEPGQHVFAAGVGINAPATAVFDDHVNNRATLPHVGIAHEQPVLFPQCGRPNGVFHQIVVNLHSTVFAERFPAFTIGPERNPWRCPKGTPADVGQYA